MPKQKNNLHTLRFLIALLTFLAGAMTEDLANLLRYDTTRPAIALIINGPITSLIILLEILTVSYLTLFLWRRYEKALRRK
jgi:hypothetical protein